MQLRTTQATLENNPSNMASDLIALPSQVAGRNSILVFVCVSFVCLCVWGAFIPPTLAHNSWTYSWDSVSYIETAGSIVAGRGLSHRAIFGLDPAIWEPLSIWPPGYPISIALLQMTGLSPMTAALAVPLISAGIFIFLFVKICLTLFHGSWALALPVVLATVCMPAFLHMSTSALSDMSFLASATASLACLLSWSSQPNASWKRLVGAGLLAAVSWGFRNTAVALFAATIFFILCHMFWLRVRDVALMGSTWLVGLALGAGPLVIRNLVAFGRLNPYTAPPSELSLVEVLAAARVEFVSDLTRSDNLARYIIEIADKRALGISAFIGLLVIGFAVRKISLLKAREILRRQKHHILFLSYAVIYMGILVVTRTIYWLSDFPGGAGPRHFLQFYWIIWIYLAILGAAALRWIRFPPKLTEAVVALGLCFAMWPQVRDQLRHLQQPVEEISIESTIGSQAARYLKGEVRDDQIVLSTKSYLLRLYLDLNARKIAGGSQCRFQPCFTREDITASGQSGVLWGLVVENVAAAGSGKYGRFFQEILEKPENYPELTRIHIEGPAAIFKYTGKIDRMGGDEFSDRVAPALFPRGRSAS